MSMATIAPDNSAIPRLQKKLQAHIDDYHRKQKDLFGETLIQIEDAHESKFTTHSKNASDYTPEKANLFLPSSFSPTQMLRWSLQPLAKIEA